jgi:uncharacterized protein YjdB
MMLALTIATAAVGVRCSGSTNPTAPTITPNLAHATHHSVLAPVLSAQISPPVETMKIGETLLFSLKLELGEGVPPSGAPIPWWSSTDSTVISIDPNGRATAIAKGSATIEVVGKAGRLTRNIHVTP